MALTLQSATRCDQREDFLHAVLDAPEDELLQQVFADWLEERGDPLGQFIRIHLELKDVPESDVQRRWTLERHQYQLRPLCNIDWIVRVRDERAQRYRALQKMYDLLDCWYVPPEVPIPVWLYQIVGSAFFLPTVTEIIVASLSSTDASDEDVEALASLTELREVDLAGTGITDAGLAHLSGLVKLESLDIRCTSVTDAGMIHLDTLENLQVLSIDDTGVTAEGRAAIQRQLPQCDIRCHIDS
jgi:uncharacterized protein (TIGR02996 family)